MPDTPIQNTGYQPSAGALTIKRTRRAVTEYGITEDGLENLETANRDASILFSFSGIFLGVFVNSLLCFLLSTITDQQKNLAKGICWVSISITALLALWGSIKQKKQSAIIKRIKEESILV